MATQNRREEERGDLWEVIVNNDDICFKHILPKLNRTDVKFLFEVNTETRALIKRSSRKIDLEEYFVVEEISSISTLQIAWEERESWDWNYFEKHPEVKFSEKVARTNKVELLKWLLGNTDCQRGLSTIDAAARQGNLEMVKYCFEKTHLYINEYVCAHAAGGGQLECLRYLCRMYDVNTPPSLPYERVTPVAAESAAQNGHLHILEYLRERKSDASFGDACVAAAANGHLDCLKYLHETVKAPWNEDAVRVAYRKKRSECLQYLLDNECPLPEGWRYEHGELYTLSSESESES